jgi:hypothetical protein
MTKIEELKAAWVAYIAARGAADAAGAYATDAAYDAAWAAYDAARAAEDDAWDAFEAARDAAWADCYAELKKIHEENSND